MDRWKPQLHAMKHLSGFKQFGKSSFGSEFLDQSARDRERALLFGKILKLYEEIAIFQSC